MHAAMTFKQIVILLSAWIGASAPNHALEPATERIQESPPDQVHEGERPISDWIAGGEFTSTSNVESVSGMQL